MLRPLYSYQKEIVKYISEKEHPAIFAEMRLGKSLCVLRALRKFKGRVLIVCPKSVINTWIDELEFEKLTRYAWFSSAELQLLKKVNSIPGFSFWVPKYIVMNYEAVMKLSEKEQKMFDCIVLDECFKGDTLVDTPNGKRPIKDLKINDTVYNGIGKAKITAVRVKKLDVWVKVTYNGREIVCSENHPFMTTKGWISAKNLKIGDCLLKTTYVQKEMSFLQKENGRREVQNTLLRSTMLSEMESEAAVVSRQVYPRSIRKSIYGAKEVVERKIFSCTTSAKKSSSNGANFPYSRYTKKSILNSSFNEVEAYSARRKWKTISNSPKQIIQVFRKGVGIGVSCFTRKTENRLSYLLQNRFSQSNNTFGDRNRRTDTSDIKNKKERPEENKDVEFFRVENITVHKQGSDDAGTRSIEENLFYDLSIENHPSFSVNEVLVHNSVRIKDPQSKTAKFFIQNFRDVKKRIILSGNPAPNSPLEYYPQMQFLNNEWMGCDNFWKYRHKFFGSDIQGWNWWVRASSKDVIRIELQKSAFILTRKQVGVENKKIYQKRVVEMPATLKKQYKMMEEKFVMELPDGKKLETKYILPQLSYLQQMAGGHILKKEMNNFKVNELIDLMMGELKNEPVLVWCRFRWEIENITAVLLKKKVSCSCIHGDVPLDERKVIQEKFQNGEIQVLVMQTQTGKYGLNLSRADTAIYFSNTLVPDDRNQSEMRIESNSKSNSLLFIDLITKDTIDEQILRSLQSKYTQSRFFLGDVVKKLKEKYGK